MALLPVPGRQRRQASHSRCHSSNLTKRHYHVFVCRWHLNNQTTKLLNVGLPRVQVQHTRTRVGHGRKRKGNRQRVVQRLRAGDDFIHTVRSWWFRIEIEFRRSTATLHMLAFLANLLVIPPRCSVPGAECAGDDEMRVTIAPHLSSLRSCIQL